MIRLTGYLCLLLGLLALAASADGDAPLAQLNNEANIKAIRQLKPQADGSFSFIVIGDNRSGDEHFKQVVKQINKYVGGHSGSAKPLFVLHAGDIVPGGTLKMWNNYADMRSTLELPVVYVRGNHEIAYPSGARNYRTLVGSTEWAFDFGGCRFIGLDNAGGKFSEKGISFLKKYLGIEPKDSGVPKRKFVMFHRPPKYGRWKVHAMRSDGDGGRGGEAMAAFKQANVTAVFMGHIHLYDEMKIDNIPYVISAGAGSPLYRKYGFGKPEYGFLVVHVTPAGVDWNWVRVH
jgi:predicted phosphodiesterase